MSRVARAAYWTVPSLFCIALYWLGLKTWFLQDDFAWLSLNRQLQETGDLWSLLFTPQAQGTIRPLSERAFFLALHGLFGMDALPFRIVVFATQCANLLLLSSIALRLTGSRMAGFLAPVLWAANGTLATAMSWTSAYNQVLCGFFVLAAFRALLAYIDTGKRRYLALQWLLFLLGFGALEIMVVYPAMAAAYIGLMARRYWRGALCLFLPSVLYTAIHWHYAPKPASGPYAMHWTSSMLATLWTYWSYALGPANLQSASMALRRWMTLAGTLALTGGLAAVVWFQLRRGNRLGLFLLACFGILLGPVLPLRDHISEYYLTMPVFALAVLGAWGLRLAWLSRWPVRAAALALAGIYFASSLPAARALTTWRYHLGERVESLVAGLVRARELYPDKAILLSDLPSDVFWGALVDKAHWTAGVQNVYLVPGSESAIQAHPELASVSDYVLPGSVAVRAIEENRAVVYSAAGERLRNVTAVFRETARTRWGASELPFRIDAGSPLFADQLGPTWHAVEGAYRWMPKRATVFLHGPANGAAKLYLSGFCAAALVKEKPLPVTVSVDGAVAGREILTKPDAAFDLAVPLPASSVGKPRIEVAIEVGHTFVAPSDGRELGLVFGTISIR